MSNPFPIHAWNGLVSFRFENRWELGTHHSKHDSSDWDTFWSTRAWNRYPRFSKVCRVPLSESNGSVGGHPRLHRSGRVIRPACFPPPRSLPGCPPRSSRREKNWNRLPAQRDNRLMYVCHPSNCKYCKWIRFSDQDQSIAKIWLLGRQLYIARCLCQVTPPFGN